MNRLNGVLFSNASTKILRLGITLLISLATTTRSYGMDPTFSFTKVSNFVKTSLDRSKDRSLYELRRTGPEQHKEEKVSQICFEKWLPKELQQQIVSSFYEAISFHDVIKFLGLQPITLVGHTRAVTSVAIAGDKVVTGSYDNTAKIWDINTGQLLHRLGRRGSVFSVAIDGDTVVTESRDQTAKIWDINTGQLLSTLPGYKDKIKSVEVLANVAIAGNKIVTASKNNVASICDLNTRQLQRTLKGHTDLVCSVAIAGDKVVTGSYDKTAKVWSLLPNLQGTIENNPLVWIMEEATIPQLDLINRAYKVTIDERGLMIIALPEKLGKVEENELQEQRDGRTYFSLPANVRQYLQDRLKIRPAQLNELIQRPLIQ